MDIEHASSAGAASGLGSVLVDPYSASADLGIPLRLLGGEGSLMVSGRSSLWGVYREPSLDEALRQWNEVDPVLMRSLVGDGDRFTDALDFNPHRHGSDLAFDDVHAALRLGFPGFRTLEASFYRGSNRISTELFAAGSDDASEALDRVVLTQDRYRWSNTLGQIQGHVLLGDRASLQLRGWASRHRLDHGYAMVDGDQVGYDPGASDVAAVEDSLRQTLVRTGVPEDGNTVEEVGVELSGDLAAGGGHFLSAGAEIARVRSSTRLLDGFVRPLVSHARAWRASGYLQDRWTLGRNVTWEGGLRVTLIKASGSPPWAAATPGWSPGPPCAWTASRGRWAPGPCGSPAASTAST